MNRKADSRPPAARALDWLEGVPFFRSAGAVEAGVRRAASDRGPLPPEVVVLIVSEAERTVPGFRKALAGPLPDAVKWTLVRAVIGGFGIAVQRYQRELKNNVEARAILRANAKAAGDIGRASQTHTRLTRAPQAQALLSDGHDVPEIAKQLGCSISTVYRALNTPQAKPSRQRRKQ